LQLSSSVAWSLVISVIAWSIFQEAVILARFGEVDLDSLSWLESVVISGRRGDPCPCIEGRKGYVLAMGDRAASSWVGILSGSVNDLKTTFGDAIAVEAQSFRAETHQAAA
jgi:hypothetical protein